MNCQCREKVDEGHTWSLAWVTFLWVYNLGNQKDMNNGNNKDFPGSFRKNKGPQVPPRTMEWRLRRQSLRVWDWDKHVTLLHEKLLQAELIWDYARTPPKVIWHLSEMSVLRPTPDWPVRTSPGHAVWESCVLTRSPGDSLAHRTLISTWLHF